MNRFLAASVTALCLVLCAFVLPSGGVLAGDKPALSAEIRRVVDDQGIEAAKKRFAEIYPSQKDAYVIDMQAMMILGQEYMNAGDMETGIAVMEMSAMLAQEMAAQMYSSNPQSAAIMEEVRKQEEAARAIEERERAEIQKQERLLEQKSQAQARGRARDDLQRFAGLYTDPENANCTLFVTVSCDGYLVTGPMWADVGPWWMRSAADTVFTYSDSYTSFSMEFETDQQGRAHTLRHELEGVGSPMSLSGSLPGEWSECVERPRR